MSSGLVKRFSVRSLHPFYRFTIGGFRPGLIPACHARFYAHRHLKPHNFLIPFPDQFAIAGKQERVGRRFKACTGSKAAPLDPCRVIECPCAAQQFDVDAANFDVFQPVASNFPGASVISARRPEFRDAAFHAAPCVGCFSFPVFGL
jgi:hypothetical protein